MPFKAWLLIACNTAFYAIIYEPFPLFFKQFDILYNYALLLNVYPLGGGGVGVGVGGPTNVSHLTPPGMVPFPLFS